jgi:hypothetical protein
MKWNNQHLIHDTGVIQTLLILILAFMHVPSATTTQSTAADSANGGLEIKAVTPCNQAEFRQAQNADIIFIHYF